MQVMRSSSKADKQPTQNAVSSWLRQWVRQSAVARLVFQLYYNLRWLPKQIRAVWNGKNLLEITNSRGIFYARPLTNTVTQTSPAFQPHIQRWIQNAPEGVYIDIGAGVGGFVTTALKDGLATEAIAFEPNPSVYPLLLKHVSANNLSAETVHAALTQDEGMMEMPPNTVHTQSSSVCGGSGVQVPTISFDQFIADKEIGPDDIGCIKISSYGHELAALEGMQQTLHKLPADARVIVEITETGDPKDKTIAFIKWCGFELADTSGKHYLFIKQ